MGRLARTRSSFAAWRRGRPFACGALTVLAGADVFFSGQLDIGTIHVELGIEGFHATIIPVLLVVLGLLTMMMPVHRIFHGVISLVVSVYSVIGVNLGGFFLGMLLGTTGGAGITLGGATPPPGGELPSQLLRVTLGLVGVTANSIVFTAPHRDVKG